MLTDIKTVFLPTDFSENANQALPYAAELALITNATLTLMYCVEEPFDFAPMVADKKEKIVEKVTARFEKLVADLKKKKRFKDLKVETKLLSGHPVVNIVEEGKADKKGVIVMGTKGATQSRNLIFGSFTTETILQSNIPVLAVPEGSSFNKFKQIVFTTDFHESDLDILSEVVELTQLFNSKIRVVHIARKKSLETEIKFRGFRELVKEKHPDAKFTFDLAFEDDFFTGIADYLDDHPADLLVMVRYKKTFWESLVSRSFTKELGFYSEVPLLVLVGNEIRETEKVT
ncbi:universal stress protein [Aliifodinibius sp. S!AR15-10]|uniref:universal stress protein n=1 Tax=Aliifodinibius sp. S!AR15-10 TaxID=2950437 RepID=UPI00285911A8|nr:universal stress protein [Aliifodinibius sp. S!AR15-10]MDR8393248.1 universal stress protein [Aliifodinibius sp. S!AR15-10]